MASIDAFNRFFEGEEVLLTDLQECVGEENVAMLTRALNMGQICSFVEKVYAPGGQRRVLTGDGLAFYELVKGLWEAGEDE